MNFRRSGLIDRKTAVVWLSSATAVGGALAIYRWLDAQTSGRELTLRVPLATELTGAIGAGLLLLPLVVLVRRWPLPQAPVVRLPLYTGALFGFAFAHTTFMWLSRALLFPVLGLGRYDYGRMPLRYLMELPFQAIIFAVVVVLLHVFEQLAAARRRELERERLAAALARAELQNLRHRLEPHFLFNALNTISSTMYRDPAAADEIIDQLALLLRRSLASTELDRVPLAEELELLEAWLAIQHARFGDRLAVELVVEPGLERMPVPPLMLQPLVENAVRHGGVETTGRGRIQIEIARRGSKVEITVIDAGGGPGTGPGTGTGLGATAERLRLLYGEDHTFHAGPRAGGGFEASVGLPYEDPTGSSATASSAGRARSAGDEARG